MLLRLKVPVYNIKVTLPKVLKHRLDYSFYILIYTISLDYPRLPLLVRSIEVLFVPFTPPSLNAILVTLGYYPLFLYILIPLL
jgi:hypothetical protein